MALATLGNKLHGLQMLSEVAYTKMKINRCHDLVIIEMKWQANRLCMRQKNPNWVIFCDFGDVRNHSFEYRHKVSARRFSSMQWSCMRGPHPKALLRPASSYFDGTSAIVTYATQPWHASSWF